ncbi:MAG TPA: XRE family transcriptional regulator [Caulobacteraceae bacterium]|jgi:transcriptional regulator with XRE-family HTH domain|nr:XRE family transcriptional regulator [Caulobacteraceae bacterium]
MTDTERTGAAIRKLRLAKGRTLAELSLETGIPLSTLSRVELGQNALKYENLMRICRALDVDLQGLVAREAETASLASGRRSVIRAGEGGALRVGPHAARLGAAELADRSLTPLTLEVVVTSLAEHGPLVSFSAEAHLTVLSGKVVLHNQFYTPLELAAGDGVYFDGRAGHALVTADPAGARVLLVVAGEWPGA